jgi:hypothetical protein
MPGFDSKAMLRCVIKTALFATNVRRGRDLKSRQRRLPVARCSDYREAV